ncbi:MAG TPA: glycosyltransferase family 4 protein, partial [Pyrinomonadaceae bacterium]|nr:glycosyltransferase family 4 protein [Pyrinomonadaceae bacterium]
VYSGLYMVLADTASRLCKLFGIRLIAVLHGGNLPEFVKRFPRWSCGVLGRADMITAPSGFLASKIGGEFEIRVIPNVLDIGPYTFRLRKNICPKLIWMRSFHSLYNPHMALQVLECLQRSFPDASLVMAGVDKGMEPELKTTAAEKNLNVRFPGFLSAEAKLKEFADADIYINTTRIDNMPVSVLEACAMGLPVVATNVGGIPYLLSDGENALLVENENAGQMAAAIERLLVDPELVETLSANGRILAERSGWPTVRGLWETAFADVMPEPAAEAEFSTGRA